MIEFKQMFGECLKTRSTEIFVFFVLRVDGFAASSRVALGYRCARTPSKGHPGIILITMHAKTTPLKVNQRLPVSMFLNHAFKHKLPKSISESVPWSILWQRATEHRSYKRS